MVIFMSDDFQELSSLTELDFNEDHPEEEEPEEFHAPVAHTKGTSLEELEQDATDDFNYIRKVYLNMIENGQISLEVAIRELKASGHPRAAEVVGGLIKQIADVSSQLLDINEQARGDRKNGEASSQTNIQNNHYYGSPNDFLNKIEEAEANAEKTEAKVEEIEDAEYEEREPDTDSEK